MTKYRSFLIVVLFLMSLYGCNAIIEITHGGVGTGGTGLTSGTVKKDIQFNQRGSDIEVSVSDILADPYPLALYTINVTYCPSLVIDTNGTKTCDDPSSIPQLISSNASTSVTSWHGTINSASQVGVIVSLTSSTGQVIKQSAVFSPHRFAAAYLYEPQSATVDGVTYLYDSFRRLWKSPDGENWFLVSLSLPFSSLLTDYVSLAGRSGMLVAGGGNGIWQSTDRGFNWTWVSSAATPNTYVNGSRNPVSLAYTADGALYAFENENIPNLWKSTNDGVTWTQQVSYAGVGNYPTTVNGPSISRIRSGFGVQGGVPLLSSGNDLYLFGGFDGTDNYNDVWKIPSGASVLTNLNSRINSTGWNSGVGGIWMARSAHAVTRFKDQWILVGGSGYITQWNSPFTYGGNPPDIEIGSNPAIADVSHHSFGTWIADESDVWSSADGVSWKRIASDTTNNPFGDGCQLFVLNDTLFSIKGNDNNGNTSNAIWKSTDAMSWTLVPIPSMKLYSNLVFQ